MEKTIPARADSRPTFAEFVLRFSRLAILALLCVVMALVAPGFFRISNLLNVLRAASLLAILGVGQTIIVLTGGIDLSMGTVATLAGIMTAWLMDRAHMPVPVAMAAGMAVVAQAINAPTRSVPIVVARPERIGTRLTCMKSQMLVRAGIRVPVTQVDTASIAAGILTDSQS